MPDTATSAARHSYTTTETVAAGAEWVINLADGQTGPIVVHQIAHGADCDVELVESSDPDGFVPDKRVTLDSLSGEGVSMGNELEANNQANLYLVLTNTAGSEADYIATGQQVRP